MKQFDSYSRFFIIKEEVNIMPFDYKKEYKEFYMPQKSQVL